MKSEFIDNINKISDGYKSNGITLISIIPNLVLIAIIIGVIYGMIRFIIFNCKRKKNKKEIKESTTIEENKEN